MIKKWLWNKSALSDCPSSITLLIPEQTSSTAAMAITLCFGHLLTSRLPGQYYVTV